MKFFLIPVLTLLVSVSSAWSQDSTATAIPNVKIKNVAGETVSTSEVLSGDGPIVLSFWATWCKPCLQELQTYNGLTADWLEKYGAHIVAVSIDDSRNASKVAPFVKSRNWSFNVLLDINQDFKRAMNVNNVPHTFVIHKGKVVFSHAAYASGDEDEIEELLAKLTGKEG